MADATIADVSDTAFWVAALRARESARPDALFHDPLAAVLTGEHGTAIARSMPYPKITAWMMAVRTVAIDRLVYETIAAGVDTIVNIGAGLDTRPYRLDLPRDLRWIEVDFPKIVDMKTARLARVDPRCRLSRIGLDVANRAAAGRAYEEIGAKARQALVITEGVIPYLTNEAAGHLAADLRRVPSFRFWIQDYHAMRRSMPHAKRLRKKLANAPFLFSHADPLGFFAGFGWKVRRDIKALDEADRLGRPFPMPFSWKVLMRLIPKARREAVRLAMGYVLLEAAKSSNGNFTVPPPV